MMALLQPKHIVSMKL